MPDSRPFAVVTGASSGIGRELARQFAEHGFDVLITAEDAELDTAAGELATTGAAVQEIGPTWPPRTAPNGSSRRSPPPAGPSTRWP